MKKKLLCLISIELKGMTKNNNLKKKTQNIKRNLKVNERINSKYNTIGRHN